MDFVSLLFKNSENEKLWREKPNKYQQTRQDIKVSELIQFLLKISSDFPEEYLYKPCLDIKDASYRIDFMNEILLNESLYQDISSINSSLKKFGKCFDEYKYIKDNIQKAYSFLILFNQSYDLLNTFIKVFSNKNSLIFKSLYDFSITTLNTKYTDTIDKTKRLEEEMKNILSDNIVVIDSRSKNARLSKIPKNQDATRKLTNLIEDFFGLKIRDSFSIVDPAPFSVLEKKLAEIFSLKYPDIFNEINNLHLSKSAIIELFSYLKDLYAQFEFYLTYVSFVKLAASSGISVCSPSFSGKFFNAKECVCPSLVVKFSNENKSLKEIVSNEIVLDKGGMFLLSGPNQGGKTIYLKTVGLTAYLATCGCLVFCEKCKIPFFDNIYTHFMQVEVPGKSRLNEEIARIESIFDTISENSLILLNESFASTRRKDGIDISNHYLRKLSKIKCSVGFVSHYYEIPEMLEHEGINIKSLRTGILGEGKRSYKVVTNDGNNLAYARDIALRCGMTYEQIVTELGGKSNEKY